MFKIVKILNGRENVPVPELLPTTASTTYTLGEALVLSSGKLIACTGAVKPQFIAAKAYTAPASSNQPLPVYVVDPNQVWETSVAFSATANALVRGSKYTVATAGAGITDVTASGTVTLWDDLGVTAVNSGTATVHVRIV